MCICNHNIDEHDNSGLCTVFDHAGEICNCEGYYEKEDNKMEGKKINEKVQEAIKIHLSLFKSDQQQLISKFRYIGERLTKTADKLSQFDLIEALKEDRLCLPINTVGELQAQGPEIDRICGEMGVCFTILKSFYQAIEEADRKEVEQWDEQVKPKNSST